jgi:hypothetical protein
LGAPNESSPRGEAGVQDGCGGLVIDFRRKRKAAGTLHDCALRHCAVRRTRHAEEYARAVFQDTGAVGSANRGKVAIASVMCTAGNLFVDRLQCGGANFDQNLSCGRNGIGELLATGRLTERVHHGRIHESEIPERVVPADSTSAARKFNSRMFEACYCVTVA